MAAEESPASDNPYLDTSLITSLQNDYLYDIQQQQQEQQQEPAPTVECPPPVQLQNTLELNAVHKQHSTHTEPSDDHEAKGGLDEYSVSLQSTLTTATLPRLPNASHNVTSASGHAAAEHDALKQLQSNEPITLDIGGSIFRTSLLTLTKYPCTIFSKMFSGNYSLQTNKDGAYFIDRDGTNFRYILNYLRTSKLIIPANNKQLIAELLEECHFYHITPLINVLSIKQIDTVILKERHISILNNFIIEHISSRNPNVGNAHKRCSYSWKLLYRFDQQHHAMQNKYTKFSRNTLESSYVVLKDFTFLSKISGYSPTLIVVSADKYILGGFTTIEWPSHPSHWKKKTILSNDSTHSTWDFLEFWAPKKEQYRDQFKYTFIYKFVNDENDHDDDDCGDDFKHESTMTDATTRTVTACTQSGDQDHEQNQDGFEYKTSDETVEFGHPELHGTIKTHREDWNQSPLPYFRTQRAASDCFDKSKPHIDDKEHLYLYHLDGSVVINNPWTLKSSYVRSWECFQLVGYKY